MKAMDDWYERLQAQLGDMYQQLEANMQIQDMLADKHGETGEDRYCDMMQHVADALPITIGVGDQLITLPNVAPVYNACLSMLVELAREYLIDLPETEECNKTLRDLAQDKIDGLLNN